MRSENPDPVEVLVNRFPGGVVVDFQLPSTPGVRIFPGTAPALAALANFHQWVVEVLQQVLLPRWKPAGINFHGGSAAAGFASTVEVTSMVLAS